MADIQSGSAQVQGEAAENAAVAGNPVLVGGRFDSSPRTLGNGDVGAIALDADGAVQVSDGGNSLTVDGSVSITGSVDTELPPSAALNDSSANPNTPMVGACALEWNGTGWDRAKSAGDNADSVAVVALGIGKNSARLMMYNGTTWDRVRGDTTNGVDVDVTRVSGNVTVVQATASSLNAQVVGTVADDGADSGNPVKVGGKMKAFDGTDPGSLSAENDRGDLIVDNNRRLYVNDVHPNYWSISADYASAQTNASVKAAPGAGLKLYITDVIISNGATAGNITLLDGSGGTVKLEGYFAINGGLAMPFRTPIALTANTALVITSTTVTTHSVTVNGYIAP